MELRNTVDDAVIVYGEAPLVADTARVCAVDTLRLDETLFFRKGAKHT